MSKDDINDLTYEQKVDLIRNGNLWCPMTFFIGLLGRIQKIFINKEFLVFAIFSIAFYRIYDKEAYHWFTYAGIAVIFILAESLKILIAERTTINASLNACIQKNIQESIQKYLGVQNENI